MSLAVLILAAGEGVRMRSSLPKVAHPILGRPMLGYVLAAARSLGPERLVAVLGHGAEHVRPIVGDARVAIQQEQLGTAHAVQCASPELGGFEGTVLVLPGDTPLLTAGTLLDLLERHKTSGAKATLLTARVPDPAGYGRVLRGGPEGEVLRIVEDKDADDEERAIPEINSGVYAFDADTLFEDLGRIGRDNAQAEFYLTDIVELMRRRDALVTAVVAADHREIQGVNSREQLADATGLLQERVNRGLMETGVTIVAPRQTFIGPDVRIGPDTTVWPGTVLEGRTTIGARCRIGPNTRMTDATVGDDATIEFAVVDNAELGQGVGVGPFARIRPGTDMGDQSRAGSFVELKNTAVGRGSKVPHLSYVGDARIGDEVNVGAGSITCNYDGFEKFETVIEDGAFVGSDTMLIAPVRIGAGAVVAAGSAISQDVPPDSLAIERGDQKTIEQWAKKRRGRRGAS